MYLKLTRFEWQVEEDFSEVSIMGFRKRLLPPTRFSQHPQTQARLALPRPVSSEQAFPPGPASPPVLHSRLHFGFRRRCRRAVLGQPDGRQGKALEL